MYSAMSWIRRHHSEWLPVLPSGHSRYCGPECIPPARTHRELQTRSILTLSFCELSDPFIFVKLLLERPSRNYCAYSKRRVTRK